MRPRESKRPDRHWVPWSAAGSAPGRNAGFQLQAHVERLETRRLLASPHFLTATATLSGTTLTVKWSEAGLGDNLRIDYTVTADVTVQYASFNNGGKHPQASNKETFQISTSSNGTFDVKNGRVNGTLSLTAPSAESLGFSSPPGQRTVLTFIEYTNVVITDTTNNISEPVSGTFTSGTLV